MNKVAQFSEYRPLLFSIAYNMLGSVMDAEDIVQDAFLRWQNARAEVESPKAYLSSIVTRLCINHLSSAKVQREEYFGPWLPEPLLTDAATPEHLTALSDTLSMAFLLVLEHLSPNERAVFLLRNVFEYEYPEIGRILDRSEASCRQLASRASRRIRAERPHFEQAKPPMAEQQALTEQFLQACLAGDLDSVMALLHQDVVSRSDGGGKASAATKPLYGSLKVAKFMMGLARKCARRHLDTLRRGERAGWHFRQHGWCPN